MRNVLITVLKLYLVCMECRECNVAKFQTCTNVFMRHLANDSSEHSYLAKDGCYWHRQWCVSVYVHVHTCTLYMYCTYVYIHAQKTCVANYCNSHYLIHCMCLFVVFTTHTHTHTNFNGKVTLYTCTMYMYMSKFVYTCTCTLYILYVYTLLYMVHVHVHVHVPPVYDIHCTSTGGMYIVYYMYRYMCMCT